MIRTLALAFSLTAFPLCAETLTIDTYAGPAALDSHPEKIAVFDVAAMDTLSALGVEIDASVSKTYVSYVSPAATTVGALHEPDYEALAAFGPDLIIAGGRSQDAVPDLSKLAPAIDMTIWEDTVGQGLARLNAYGALFGKETEAADLAATFDTALAKAKAALDGQGTALIVMTNGPKVSAYGTGGRFGWLHTALDLPEAVQSVEASTHGEAVSFEFIRDANPDILIVIDRLAAIGRDGDSAQATLDNALVHETTAWKTGKVLYLDSAEIYIAAGGIQSMTRTLDQITAAFSGS